MEVEMENVIRLGIIAVGMMMIFWRVKALRNSSERKASENRIMLARGNSRGLLLGPASHSGNQRENAVATDDLADLVASFSPNKAWQEMDFLMTQGDLDGKLCARVSYLLQQLGSLKIEKFRMAFVLEMLEFSSEQLVELSRSFGQYPDMKIRGFRYLEEANLLGFVEIEEDKVALTSLGHRELKSAREEGYSLNLWAFIEERLHETLSVMCPCCGHGNLTHWFWTYFECSGCGKTVAIEDCDEIQSHKNSHLNQNLLMVS